MPGLKMNQEMFRERREEIFRSMEEGGFSINEMLGFCQWVNTQLADGLVEEGDPYEVFEFRLVTPEPLPKPWTKPGSVVPVILFSVMVGLGVLYLLYKCYICVWAAWVIHIWGKSMREEREGRFRCGDPFPVVTIAKELPVVKEENPPPEEENKA